MRGGRQGVQPVTEDELLDLVLVLVGELVAGAGEDLDAVVLVRVVRGGDDEPGVGAHRLGHVRDAGGRQHADPLDIAAHRGDARHQCALQHVAGDPGVLADDDPHPVRGRLVPAHHVRDGLAQTEGGDRVHRISVGLAADAVGAEQLAHLLCLLLLPGLRPT
ncbi:hypothetical protein SDC9_172288 [bioreactor metagenome]|uniref:Uncharacterized protein n=1 Tax=bioreactor metagenome TaxID=1076179 RepID=A0A645GMF5_9ZZZZ